MNKNIIYISIFILALILLLFIPKDHELIFQTSGSFANIRLYHLSQIEKSILEKDIKSLCRRYEEEFSVNIKNSLVSKLNTDKSIEKENNLLKLIRTGIEFSKKTEGVYDITAAPLLDTWGFTDMISPEIPDPEDLMKALMKIDYTKIKIGARKITIGKEQSIDPGAFSKGLLIDKIYNIIVKRGIECIVEIGGDMRVFSKDDRVFKVGIQHPRRSDVLKILELKSTMAVATSGDYERCFDKNGKKYHHLLSTKTGMPVRYQASVSVVADSCILADAQSTVFFLMGHDWVNEHKNNFEFREAIFADEEGNIKIIKKK
ncbi:MAG: hypothetical protein C0601_10220 [Candidatus Muiribacterium halophilum]|uniref:FAD:protein FMN transferase n=1 Tax=Muiribacterium halophilum TaxID=2053465 RepID=A0A2N5ZCN4_MUIH1|nr:MAG: hypothetical protein C0601_10220 [Candidatus Muirbacterium halophilum]